MAEWPEDGRLMLWRRKGIEGFAYPVHLWIDVDYSSLQGKSGYKTSPARLWIEGSRSAFWPPGKPKPNRKLLRLTHETESRAQLIVRLRAAAVGAK